MWQTLKIEWMKVKNYRTFWILLIITIVSIPAFNYSIYDFGNNSFPKVRGQSLFGSPFAFPDVWPMVTWVSSLLFIIPAILIITLTTNEFTYRTHRQNIIDGWSRKQFIYVKIFEVLLLSILTTLVVFLTCLFFGSVLNKAPDGVSIFKNIQYLFYYFVQMLSYSSIAFLLSMFIRRAGLSMGIFFIYMVMEQFIVALMRNKYHQDWVNYLPEEVNDKLIPSVFERLVTSPDAKKNWENHIPIFLGLAALYLIIYYVVTTWRFRKADL
ncbi:MAG: ABC transporter permease [Bacteroidetes bacterium]|nr:ABC transporter permease [Bacteroidota bacterium]